MPILADISSKVIPVLKVDVDNKEVRTEITNASDELLPELSLRLLMMKRIQEQGFSIGLYLNTRNEVLSGNVAANARNMDMFM